MSDERLGEVGVDAAPGVGSGCVHDPSQSRPNRRVNHRATRRRSPRLHWGVETAGFTRSLDLRMKSRGYRRGR